MSPKKESKNVIDIAKYIINSFDDKEFRISNIELQKVLYYLQAAFLVEFNKPCFEEKIIAWKYGPVVEEAYRKFSVFGSQDIPKQEKSENFEFNFEKMKIEKNEKKYIPNQKEKEVIDNVIEAYGNVEDPFYLVKKTHDEDPWKNTDINKEIEIKKILDYYIEDENRKKIYNK